jgi:hypothetical protein
MEYTINQLFRYKPGNHGLTEETIYAQQPTSEEDSIPIFSGSGDNESPIGFIRSAGHNKHGRPLAYFQGPCLILTKDGSAGLLTYKPPKFRFTINHHACVLTVRKEWRGKLDLQWFVFEKQHVLLRGVTSQSDNRIFNTSWFDRLKFEIPDYETIQIPQRDQKLKLLDYKKKLSQIISSIDVLIDSPLEA